MEFVPINLSKDRDVIIAFRRDSFVVSFGTAEDFHEDQYLDWLRTQIKKYPEGFVLALEDNYPVGQVELTIRECEGRTIGYVNLFYLIADKRGMGFGRHLQRYAMEFFRKHGVQEYHLRVSPTNKRAISFYYKNGMRKLKSEFDDQVIRMVGEV